MGENASWIGQDLPPLVRSGLEYFPAFASGYLVPNTCPHPGGPLKFGYINEKEPIVCPMHHNAYSIERLIARDSTLNLCGPVVSVPFGQIVLELGSLKLANVVTVSRGV